MRSNNLGRIKRLSVLGVLLGPAFWILKKLLIRFHVLRDTTLVGMHQKLAEFILNVTLWDVVSFLLLGVAGCSLIVLYVTVAPPPRD